MCVRLPDSAVHRAAAMFGCHHVENGALTGTSIALHQREHELFIRGARTMWQVAEELRALQSSLQEPRRCTPAETRAALIALARARATLRRRLAHCRTQQAKVSQSRPLCRFWYDARLRDQFHWISDHSPGTQQALTRLGSDL